MNRPTWLLTALVLLSASMAVAEDEPVVQDYKYVLRSLEPHKANAGGDDTRAYGETLSAIGSAGHFRVESAIPLLKEILLETSDEKYRDAAAKSLSEIRTREALQVLEAAAKGDNAKVAGAAKSALAEVPFYERYRLELMIGLGAFIAALVLLRIYQAVRARNKTAATPTATTEPPPAI